MKNEDHEIIVVTPTYNRPKRIEYLKRCIKQFSKISNLFWIVVEDDAVKDHDIEKLLKSSGLEYVYLSFGPTRCWGNHQRNHALGYIRDNKMDGIVYFADDDNYYKARLFNEIRKTKNVSIFPVGHLGPRGIERPIVKKGSIIGWDADWETRKYPIDMAGFAFHSSLLNKLSNPLWAFMPEDKRRGGESEFMERLISSDSDLEILCNGCRKCYVWHDQPLNETVGYTRLKCQLNIYRNLFIFRFVRRVVRGIYNSIKQSNHTSPITSKDCLKVCDLRGNKNEKA